MQATQKIKVPAGKLTLDGDTYQHREILKKNGWKYAGRSEWTRETKGIEVVIRKGCRLCVQTRDESGKLSSLNVIYSDGVGPTTGRDREDHDTFDMI